jgi:hypothetical protein
MFLDPEHSGKCTFGPEEGTVETALTVLILSAETS